MKKEIFTLEPCFIHHPLYKALTRIPTDSSNIYCITMDYDKSTITMDTIKFKLKPITDISVALSIIAAFDEYNFYKDVLESFQKVYERESNTPKTEMVNSLKYSSLLYSLKSVKDSCILKELKSIEDNYILSTANKLCSNTPLPEFFSKFENNTELLYYILSTYLDY